MPAVRLGPRSIGFALFPHSGSWSEAGVLEQMEAYQHRFLTAPGEGTQAAVPEGAGLELSGDGVILRVAAAGDQLEARVVNQTGRAADGDAGRSGRGVAALGDQILQPKLASRDDHG